jgi:hypothetical protein
MVTYADSNATKSVTLEKKGIEAFDWLEALPTPFSDRFTVYLKAPESGSAVLRLIDVNGNIIQSRQVSIIQNTVYNIPFTNVSALAKAVYFVQYIGPKQKKTVKVFKG